MKLVKDQLVVEKKQFLDKELNQIERDSLLTRENVDWSQITENVNKKKLEMFLFKCGWSNNISTVCPDVEKEEKIQIIPKHSLKELLVNCSFCNKSEIYPAKTLSEMQAVKKTGRFVCSCCKPKFQEKERRKGLEYKFLKACR